MSMDDESEAMASQLAKLMATEVERVYKSKAMPNLNQSITHAYASIFANAIEKGYGVNFDELDYNSTDFNAITNLINSAYQFAAAKNYTQLRQLTTALVDDQKKLRSFSEFKKVAYTITDAHNNQWLKTEYNTAIASAQMASKWQDIQANKNTLPLLQMDVIVDAQTSDICKPLEGIIKPIGDPFWATYYPPNHFGCRSTVKQLAKGKITPDNEIVHPEKVPPMFKTNLAQNGMLFPKDHPYFIGVPSLELKKAKALMIDINYETRIVGKNGGYVDVHAKTDANKKAQHIEASKVLADKGHQIKLMPEIHIKDKANRQLFFPELEEHNAKNPDARFNGVLGDYKIPDKNFVDKNSIKNAINTTASKQVSICVISLLGKDYKLQEILSQMRGSLKNKYENASIKEVWLITNRKELIIIPRGLTQQQKFYKIINAF